MNSAVDKFPTTVAGYRTFELGGFSFIRDEYFVTISWPVKTGRQSHTMSADAFLRALMRDIAWGFFYGVVNFDPVFGTRNLYGKVEFFGGRFNEHYHNAGRSYVEVFETPRAMKLIKEMMADWVNEGFDPFAAPMETGDAAFGEKNGSNLKAIDRFRVATKRMPGLKGDSPLRAEENGYSINRAFADVSQDQPEIKAEPGFEDELHAFSLFSYLSRSDVTWNPSVTSVCKNSLFCPTTEEYILPIIHGNDRVEWFMQFSDEIMWNITDKETGRPRARVLMKAGDLSAMPADIGHQGFSKKRSMLLVWENGNPEIVRMHESGELPPTPVSF
ncbi:hydroxyquinol 1,2-dioxygenase [Rhodoferax ferrireducens]|uniref:hydroxyquinol 1,2-dioxygenase n=1 Tax=Rhodoferax ferrireducens TaxID=192843 RepID=UPI000E0CC32E|nr:hydroxyquinol 1,2-dioxygenase [Rhodoferax ferrireducens]